MFAQHMEISISDLDDKSIEFLIDNYSELMCQSPIYFVEYDDSRNGRIDEFEVHFVNGTIIEFDENGDLKAITCGESDVIPLFILPYKIKNALKNYTINFDIIEYSINKHFCRKEYYIKFNNGNKIKINKNGKIKK